MEIALHALRSGRWYVGIGVGAVDLPLPASPREGSGPAFVAARAAVEKAKSGVRACAHRRRLRGPAQGRGCALARGIRRRPRLRQRRGGAAADRTAGPGPDRRPVEGRGCAALGAARPRRHARHAENRGPGTGNHGTVGEPCAAALRLAGRMGREAGGGNAAGLRPRSNHRQRRRRRAARGPGPGRGRGPAPGSRPRDSTEGDR